MSEPRFRRHRLEERGQDDPDRAAGRRVRAARLAVATVKHAHHAADIDQPGTDSFRHRAAGASEVALVGGQRYAIMREQEEPTLAEVLARLAPADLVLIEGFKREPHPKIEVRSGADDTRPMDVAKDPNIVAIAADQPPADRACRGSRRDDIAGIADFIAGASSALTGEDAGRPCSGTAAPDGEGAGLVLAASVGEAEERAVQVARPAGVR